MMATDFDMSVYATDITFDLLVGGIDAKSLESVSNTCTAVASLSSDRG